MAVHRGSLSPARPQAPPAGRLRGRDNRGRSRRGPVTPSLGTQEADPGCRSRVRGGHGGGGRRWQRTQRRAGEVPGYGPEITRVWHTQATCSLALACPHLDHATSREVLSVLPNPSPSMSSGRCALLSRGPGRPCPGPRARGQPWAGRAPPALACLPDGGLPRKAPNSPTKPGRAGTDRATRAGRQSQRPPHGAVHTPEHGQWEVPTTASRPRGTPRTQHSLPHRGGP